MHAFQGSESDVVIVDLVESRNDKIGKLYHCSTGNRLANVAISRAKDKLILIGSERFFHAWKCKTCEIAVLDGRQQPIMFRQGVYGARI